MPMIKPTTMLACAANVGWFENSIECDLSRRIMVYELIAMLQLQRNIAIPQTSDVDINGLVGGIK